MNLHRLLQRRLADGRPVRVGLIGAGKFGSMFLSQVPSTTGIEVAVIADLAPARARHACANVGWTEDRIAGTRFVDDASGLIAAPDVEVVIEATGHATAGLAHAQQAIAQGKHIVMVNVEADVVAGVKAVIAEMGSPTMKDMGTVMKNAMARFAGAGMRVDGKMVSEAVKRELAGK